ncbi:Protein kinase C and casein kinase substrate in neurons protein [Trichinella pseudospiralis]
MARSVFGRNVAGRFQHFEWRNCFGIFWEIGQYKRSVRRIEDAPRLCSELSLLIRERSEIEAAYAKSLQQWSKNGLNTSIKVSNTVVRKKLGKHFYKKEGAKRSAFKTARSTHRRSVQLKESKEIEESFKRAQKPWAKLYGKILKAKREYFSSSRMERSAVNQEKNAAGNPEISREQVKKFHEKMVKCQTEREKAEEEYRKTVAAISDYKSTYQADMMQVFKRCQELE